MTPKSTIQDLVEIDAKETIHLRCLMPANSVGKLRNLTGLVAMAVIRALAAVQFCRGHASLNLCRVANMREQADSFGTTHGHDS